MLQLSSKQEVPARKKATSKDNLRGSHIDVEDQEFQALELADEVHGFVFYSPHHSPRSAYTQSIPCAGTCHSSDPAVRGEAADLLVKKSVGL